MSSRLDEIKAREAAATKGPWDGLISQFAIRARDSYICDGIRPGPDKEFITHARQDIPWLIERVEAFEKIVREYEEHCTSCGPTCTFCPTCRKARAALEKLK